MEEKMYTKSEVISMVRRLADKEACNCKRYCELNPGTEDERKTKSFFYQAACLDMLFALK